MTANGRKFNFEYKTKLFLLSSYSFTYNKHWQKERTVQNSGGGDINSLNHTQIKYIEQWYTVVTFINHDWIKQIRFEFILCVYHSKLLMGITTTNDE